MGSFGRMNKERYTLSFFPVPVGACEGMHTILHWDYH